MPTEDPDTEVQRLTEGVLAEMKEGQEAHPRATLQEIETAVAVPWARVQAKVAETRAHARAAAPINTLPPRARSTAAPEWRGGAGAPGRGAGQDTRGGRTGCGGPGSCARVFRAALRSPSAAKPLLQRSAVAWSARRWSVR